MPAQNPPQVSGARSRFSQFLRGKLLHDLITLLGSEILSKLVGFAAFAYLARALSPEGYGAVEFAIGVVMILLMVVECGLCPVGVRRYAVEPGRLPILAGEIPAVRFAIALLVVPVLWITLPLFGLPPATTDLVRLFGLGLLFIPFYQKWLFQSLEKMHLVGFAPVIRMGAFALGVVLVVKGPNDLMLVGWVELVAALVGAAYFMIVQKRVGIPFRMKGTTESCVSLAKEGCLIGMSDMLLVLVQYFPLLLVAILIGGEETAWIGAPQRCAIAAVAFSGVYFFNLYPSLTRRFHISKDAVLELVRESHRVVAWGGVFGAILVTLLAEPLLVLAFGKKFAEAAPVFAILIWMLPIALLAGHARWVLTAAGLQGRVLRVHLAGLIAIVPVGAILVPILQGEGAALAAVIASAIMWAAAHYTVKWKVMTVPGLSYALRPLALAGGCFALSRATQLSVWLDGGIALAVFLVVGPLVDRRLIPAIGSVAQAKADRQASP